MSGASEARRRGFGEPQGVEKQTLFVEDFDAPEMPAQEDTTACAEPEVIAPVFTEEDLTAAREAGYEAGLAAGRAMVQGAREAALDAMLTGIRSAMADAEAAAGARGDEIARELAAFLANSLASVLPDLVRRHGQAEVRRLFAEILPPMALEPEIVVRVAAGNERALAEDLALLDAAFAERVRLVTDTSMTEGDVAINWRDGSATRDTQALRRRLEEVWRRLGLDNGVNAERELADAE